MLDDAQLAALRESFKTEVLDLLSELESVLMDMEEQSDDLDLTNRAFRALHSIKGSGTMFGFDEMSEFVHEIENVFDRVRKGEIPVSKRLIDLTLAAKDELLVMLKRSSPDATPRKETTERLLQGYRTLLGTEGGSTTHKDSATAPDNADSSVRTSRSYRIAFRPAPDILRTGTDPLMLIDELHALGTCRVVAETDRVPALEELIVDECYLSWTITLRTSRPREEIEAVFEFVASESELSIEMIDDVPDETNAKTVQPSTAQASPSAPAAQTAAGTIRVPSNRLDSLVDLIGELVTVQARMSGHVVNHGDPVFESIAESIERLTNELRDNAMSLRMVPIGGTFSRMRRLVRDLSGQLAKEVRLEVSGEDTELDKTVIERLGDPLMHIIRNAIDHGIEPPEQREQAGKERTGVIHLRAAHEGGTVVVAVTDDGGGLDTDRIRAIAVERGVIGADAELTDSETRNLIFAPGFSTATEVTEVSGRGVGMDVVRKTIDTLGGSIETMSETGAGTTVVLRLPLTLAIIDGLLVGVGDQDYVLPLSTVQELLEFDASTVRRSSGVRLMEYRGSLLPYVDLYGLFECSEKIPEDAQVVVVDWDGDRVGLVVGAVRGRQQTVIKSLHSLPKQVDGVSGATILGDGSVALILDVPKLISNTESLQTELQLKVG